VRHALQGEIMELFVLAGLIVLNGAFAMSEVALLTARKSRLTTLARRGDALAAAAVKLGEEPTRFLSTIQIGITCIGLLSGILSEAVFAVPLAVWFQSLGLEHTASGIAATAVVVISVTYVSIVIGEIVPKRLGQRSAESIARLVAWPMRVLALASGPFVHLLAASTDAILKPLFRMLGIPAEEFGAQALSLDEVRTIVLESSNILPKKHVTILLNLFDLEAITVDDVMVPRNQIEAIDIEAHLEDIVQQLATAHHRRVLVYRHHLTTSWASCGAACAESAQQANSRRGWGTGARALLCLRHGAFSQLQNFQEQQERVSLVVDEYGELLGLVMLEDILDRDGVHTRSRQERGFVRQRRYIVEGGTLLRTQSQACAALPARRTANDQRPDPGASARHPGAEYESEDSRLPHRDSADPGPRRAHGAYLPRDCGAGYRVRMLNLWKIGLYKGGRDVHHFMRKNG
jgi:putative hemolysin